MYEYKIGDKKNKKINPYKNGFIFFKYIKIFFDTIYYLYMSLDEKQSVGQVMSIIAGHGNTNQDLFLLIPEGYTFTLVTGINESMVDGEEWKYLLNQNTRHKLLENPISRTYNSGDLVALPNITFELIYPTSTKLNLEYIDGKYTIQYIYLYS